MSTQVVPRRTYFTTFAALMALLLITIAVGFGDLGPLNLVVAMTIAVSKTLLIVLYFMHMRRSAHLLWVFVTAGFFWLAILISLVMSDYLTRGW